MWNHLSCLERIVVRVNSRKIKRNLVVYQNWASQVVWFTTTMGLKSSIFFYQKGKRTLKYTARQVEKISKRCHGFCPKHCVNANSSFYSLNFINAAFIKNQLLITRFVRLLPHIRANLYLYGTYEKCIYDQSVNSWNIESNPIKHI